jgi:hypothetical protein
MTEFLVAATRTLCSRLTAGRSAVGPATRGCSKRPTSSAKHYHGSIGTRYDPVSCSALLGRLQHVVMSQNESQRTRGILDPTGER